MGTLRLRIDGTLLRGELELDGERTSFAAERPLLGRLADCDIRIPGTGYAISKKHVQLDHANGAVRIRDLSSPQGIFINGKHMPSETPHPIRDGDQVQIGAHDFLIRIG